MNTRNIHDAFARKTLSRRENVLSFFKGILSEEVVNRLDFETLTEENTSYTDEELSAYFSDVVYQCSYRGSPLKLARYIPGFEYLLVDLSTISDRMLKRLFAHNPAVRLWLLC